VISGIGLLVEKLCQILYNGQKLEHESANCGFKDTFIMYPCIEDFSRFGLAVFTFLRRYETED